MVTKLANGELSYARWTIGAQNEQKRCAFTDDELSMMVVTKTGLFYKLPIAIGD